MRLVNVGTKEGSTSELIIAMFPLSFDDEIIFSFYIFLVSLSFPRTSEKAANAVFLISFVVCRVPTVLRPVKMCL